MPVRVLAIKLCILAACSGPLHFDDPAVAAGAAGLIADLDTALGVDVVGDLDGWRVDVRTQPLFVECAHSVTALGCTTLAVAAKQAWIRLARADGWELGQTAFQHEIVHVWLAATTGDGDADHVGPAWGLITALHPDSTHPRD